MKKIFPTLFTPFLASTLLLLLCAGCKQEGPTGPKGPSGNLYPEDGYIAYTLTGVRSDGTPFAEKDSLTGIQYASEIRINLDSWKVYARRYRQNDAFINSYLSASGDTAFNNLNTGYMEIEFAKVMPDNSLFYFNTSADIFPSSSEDKLELSNLAWDKVKGRFTGSFIVTGDNNTSGNPATVSGHFDFAVMEIVKRP